MAKHILLLHSSNDTALLSEFERNAQADSDDQGWQVWADAPALAKTATLGAHAPIDVQVRQAIEQAFAVVYFVGRTGPGPYQALKEAAWVEAALAARSEGGNPLLFVPALLREGDMSGLADWMRHYPVVNMARDLSDFEIWQQIRLRLTQTLQSSGPSHNAGSDIDDESIRGIVDTLGQPSNLTILIGPYTHPGQVEIGPAAMTGKLLKRVDIRPQELSPLLPWPSEAAEWLSIGIGRPAVDQFFTGPEMTKLGFGPSDLMVRIADLARRWTSRYPTATEGWSGLLLLTTRVDLALESALLSAPVRFTRLTPTAGRLETNRNLMLQRWSPGGPYVPNPSARSGPWTNVTNDKIEMKELSLDDVDPVMLVKLCGSIDIGGSLVVTVSDFFQHAPKLAALPPQIRASIQSSPQLLIGRGFASPLCQLVRYTVLGNRLDNLPRELVMPKSEPNADSLCDLEMRLLDVRSKFFIQAMDLTSVLRTDPCRFLTQLTLAI